MLLHTTSYIFPLPMGAARGAAVVHPTYYIAITKSPFFFFFSEMSWNEKKQPRISLHAPFRKR